jgi:anionic cell wall polymer biosynthesis LytR-Cps2A-Psr (LCP) family protein
LIEAELYVRDTYKNIRKKIQKNNIKIKELYGINGIVKI